MKLVRYGEPGREKPGLIHENALRDISSIVPDLAGEHLTRQALAKVKAADPASLPAVSGNPRLGPCVARPCNFIAVGLNFADVDRPSACPWPGGSNSSMPGDSPTATW